jgi:hypothetical protein
MGKFSGSTAATYTLTPTEYRQTQLFNVANDASDRAKIVYDMAEKTLRAPVKMDGGRIEFKPGDETLKDTFTDVWEKVP